MTVIDRSVANAPAARERRLLVTIRPSEPENGTRPYRAIGLLTCSADGYTFSYLPQAKSQEAFEPIAGFGDVEKTYRSDELFPAFAQRVMSARRPDRPQFLRAINLNDDSQPWEILSRSGGRRGGDTIEVMEEPVIATDGSTSSTFLVHGVRHQDPEATERILRLQPDEPLRLRFEPDNPVNSRAVLVTADEGQPLGHVPDPLVDYVNQVMGSDYNVRVVRANGPNVSPHLRLLVRLTGTVEPNYRPFGL